MSEIPSNTSSSRSSDTSLNPALRELADLVGILPDYHDIWGGRHETGDATRRALLAALGFSAATDEEAQAALAAWRAQEAATTLPPVLVQPADSPIVLPVRLGNLADDAENARYRENTEWRWRIAFEAGDELGAAFQPGALEAEPGQAGALRLALPAVAQWGYHHLELWRDDRLLADMPLIVCPPRCYEPGAIADQRRVWGLSVQLYGLRSRQNWGIGDYADLRQVVEWAAEAGASLVGVNPLHALFPHDPAHCSPYSPSSREFFNTLHLSIESLPEWHECEAAKVWVETAAFREKLAALRAAPMVDYETVGALKNYVLSVLYKYFRVNHLNIGSARGAAFRAFQARGGDALYRFALYHALQADFARRDPALWGWPVWPLPYRDPASAEVAAFAAANLEAIEYQQWLQWLAETQLAAVGQRAYELGLGIGLYQDMAVGVDKGGAETWMHQELYALDARVGCPPDDFNPLGQDWGLPPWIPHRLRAAAYAPFIRMLRANMAHAGALRIDHVMSLMRLYWVPPSLGGDQGAYLAYPLADLAGILALESQRNRCLVVGEDLGTVPDAVRHTLHELGVLSYRLFYFERGGDGDFQPSEHFPRQALVAASTHDLATLAGFWRGEDIRLRTALGLFSNEGQRIEQLASRAEDRARLLALLARSGLLPDGLDVTATHLAELPDAVIQAVHRHLARSPAAIVLAQAEDMLGETEQANLPGTIDEHPNWRRKLALALEDWRHDRRPAGLAAALAAERPRQA